MKFVVFFVRVLVSVFIHFRYASSNSSLSQTALIQAYFPCDSLLLRRSAWQTTYFESSRLPDGDQAITDEELASFVHTFGATCGGKLPNTSHTLLCSKEAFTLVPPKKSSHAIVFMHGVVLREDVAIYLPFFSMLLASEPELVSTLHVEYPLAPFRRITAGEDLIPAVSIGRAWFDIHRIPNETYLSMQGEPGIEEDRLGLYRTAELIDVIVRSQHCKLSIPSNHVVLMGHSLGAVATLEAVMATNLPLAGAVAMSGILPRAGDYMIQDVKAYSPSQRKYTVTMIHGTDDDIIPFALGNGSAQIVKNVMESTGGGLRFVQIKDADHFLTFFQSFTLYETVLNVLREAFRCPAK